MSLLEIAKVLTDLTDRARAGKLAQDDVRGGTFSISNHGVSGSLFAAPIIINQPQSAILGVGKLEKRAVVRDDAIVIRPLAYVTLTIDHRVITPSRPTPGSRSSLRCWRTGPSAVRQSER